MIFGSPTITGDTQATLGSVTALTGMSQATYYVNISSLGGGTWLATFFSDVGRTNTVGSVPFTGDGVAGFMGGTPLAGFVTITNFASVAANAGISVTWAQWRQVMLTEDIDPAGPIIMGPNGWTLAVMSDLSILTAGGLAGGGPLTSDLTLHVANGPGLDASLNAVESALHVEAAGTPYTLTVTPAEMTFGTTRPNLTITAAGTYLIRASSVIDLSASSGGTGGITATFKLRRTNNTPADLAGGTTTGGIWYSGAAKNFVDALSLPELVYVTANTNDVIQLWGSLSAVPTGGITCTAAQIVAERIA